MSDGDTSPAATRVVLEAELHILQAVVDDVDSALAAYRQELTALDRFEKAMPKLEHLEQRYPERSTTREMLQDAESPAPISTSRRVIRSSSTR